MIEMPAIAGLTVAKRTSDHVEITVGPEAGEGAFLRLLFWLPRGHELSFYDQYFPGTSGDPGAYVDVQRKNDWFLYHMGNHGWSSDWATQSPELMAAWMSLNLKAKAGNPEPLKKIEIRENARLPEAFIRKQ
ncbi:MAG: hypothetical protein E8D46_00270 [Nitrospira sp.]|nr:hypothetical protein [Nitrospira sp.]TKB76083.1 MAG: hypothetical protein E8D46_00270 [Nitrospira sp.]